MEVAAAAVPRTYPISLVPSPCKTATAHPPQYRIHHNGCCCLSSKGIRQKTVSPILSTRLSKMPASSRTLASKTDTATVEPRKNQSYLSEEDEEMEIDSKFIERLELLEEQALQIGNDSDDDEDGGGREATDYNRRAQIFDKCSKVFQALKHGE
ncbi:hypothetical protein C5167_024686 [Papaver somniferum]|uniref:Uncharacterized protein n=1 Tax=Papaver somniferum TaxID=3469 RepID=A0A4Y7JQE2_PAPSO|nr:hypothetical protein C5167_024686 [Papaver somniferum]